MWCRSIKHKPKPNATAMALYPASSSGVCRKSAHYTAAYHYFANKKITSDKSRDWITPKRTGRAWISCWIGSQVLQSCEVAAKCFRMEIPTKRDNFNALHCIAQCLRLDATSTSRSRARTHTLYSNLRAVFFLLISAFVQKSYNESGSMQLTPASPVINWSNPQARGSLSVIGLLYREWVALRRIAQYTLPQFAIGDVVRAEMTIEHRTNFVYGSIRQRWRHQYVVVYHEEEKQGEENHRHPMVALRSPNQLWPERWDFLSKRCAMTLFFIFWAPRHVWFVNKLILGVIFVMEDGAGFEWRYYYCNSAHPGLL